MSRPRQNRAESRRAVLTVAVVVGVQPGRESGSVRLDLGGDQLTLEIAQFTEGDGVRRRGQPGGVVEERGVRGKARGAEQDGSQAGLGNEISH